MRGPQARVIGGGVSGLTTALCLLQRGFPVRITEADNPRSITSSVAPAMWFPTTVEPRARVCGWMRTARCRYREIAGDARSGVRSLDAVAVAGDSSLPWWHDELDGWREARSSELPGKSARGWLIAALVIETPRYLPWLREQAATAGAEFERRTVSDLGDEIARAPGLCVVDCCGLGAAKLCDDVALFPSRGQIVRVSPLPLERFYVDQTAGQFTYVVPRSDATVLGTTVENGASDIAVDAAQTAAIVERAAALVPAVADADVIDAVAGRRPCRPEVRLEAEPFGDGLVVHNYGHGGAGYTLAWGCAEEAADLVGKHMS